MDLEVHLIKISNKFQSARPAERPPLSCSRSVAQARRGEPPQATERRYDLRRRREIISRTPYPAPKPAPNMLKKTTTTSSIVKPKQCLCPKANVCAPQHVDHNVASVGFVPKRRRFPLQGGLRLTIVREGEGGQPRPTCDGAFVRAGKDCETSRRPGPVGGCPRSSLVPFGCPQGSRAVVPARAVSCCKAPVSSISYGTGVRPGCPNKDTQNGSDFSRGVLGARRGLFISPAK